ncbi:hypothetical protein VCUG_02238 [Vavraia culicis subsp. floridensis]|uniref:Uncharacterized protein n=1 Tax=Vavraia culicis (isolate floridensis) TaxID=948595 RepID=L2GRI7_VAVCU|nr:uncharacterized protein VCUG_02238 [Vavraia culicis subsp. floridensis]ELA46271.1 hypothetical protein VCUG_02238 [Vavraia culicis subsp. floridensis]
MFFAEFIIPQPVATAQHPKRRQRYEANVFCPFWQNVNPGPEYVSIFCLITLRLQFYVSIAARSVTISKIIKDNTPPRHGTDIIYLTYLSFRYFWLEYTFQQ